MTPDLLVRSFPLSNYLTVWEKMRQFTQERTEASTDEIWLVEHPPIYTLGQKGKLEHIINPNGIPIIHTDRGGQVTYHGPGQIVAYILIDVKRKNIGVRDLVTLLEKSLIAVLKRYGISAFAKPEAPGVYVAEGKIGSIGLRIRRGCSYHGLSFNVDMDLTPFKGINPCGYQNLSITQLADLLGRENVDKNRVSMQLVSELLHHLQYKKSLMSFGKT